MLNMTVIQSDGKGNTEKQVIDLEAVPAQKIPPKQSFYSRAHPGKLGLLMDWETSGSNFGGDSTVEYQGLSFGAVIFNTTTFEEVDSLYVEMQFDAEKYKWSDEAEKIHGLTREHLATQMSRVDALVAFLEFILKYFAPDSKPLFVGHNRDFDIAFTAQLFNDFEAAMPHWHHVAVDSSGIAFAMVGEYKSDVVFELLGGIQKRGDHNALDDARACLSTLRAMRQIFERGLQ